MTDQFIVAEITKSWTADSPVTDLLSQRFEGVINRNHERGYSLKEWKVNSVVNDNTLTETIIAIFEKADPLRETIRAILNNDEN